MTANARNIRRDRVPGSMEGVRPGESLDEFEKRVGDDAPEWTEEDFKRARPIDDFPDLKAALERARGQRGPQKTPIKDRVGLRLDHEVVEHFRSTGPGWQSRINDILVEHVKRSGR